MEKSKSLEYVVKNLRVRAECDGRTRPMRVEFTDDDGVERAMFLFEGDVPAGLWSRPLPSGFTGALVAKLICHDGKVFRYPKLVIS
jgi:hypothetical protein